MARKLREVRMTANRSLAGTKEKACCHTDSGRACSPSFFCCLLDAAVAAAAAGEEEEGVVVVVRRGRRET